MDELRTLKCDGTRNGCVFASYINVWRSTNINEHTHADMIDMLCEANGIGKAIYDDSDVMFHVYEIKEI